MELFAIKMYAMLQSGLLSLRESKADKERGATAVEYGLLVALIAAVIVVIVATLGKQINNAFSTISAQL